MILTILNELATDNSRLAKEAILKRETNNFLLQRVVKAALDPHINYWQVKIPEYATKKAPKHTLSDGIDALVPLVKRDYTGNAAIEYLAELLSELSKDDAIVIERIIQRDLRCGVSESTANKIWPGIIPTFDVMLAHKDTSGIKYPAYAQIKSDGMRCHLAFDGRHATAWTRNGKEIKIHDALDSAARILMIEGETWDGELILWDEENEKPFDRKTGNGIINKGVKDKGMSVEESKLIRFVCWDIVDYTSTKPYSLRLSEMNSRFATKLPQNKFIPVTTIKVNSYEEALVFYSKCIDNGEEGSILKNINSMWVPKRTKDLGKMKAEEEADLKVVGIKPGTGKFEGMVGSLECETRDGKLNVFVSGFTDGERAKLSEKDIGRILTVKYNQRIKDKKSGKWSLFLPRAVEFRDDKNNANSVEELK